jgi:D-alanyl-D-alanine dipeptidase
MNKIIYITDPKILAIPIIENNEVLIDIKNSQELQYGPPPECELTATCYTKLRKTVFEKLCQAQTDLPKGWRWRLYEGFRSLQVQKMLFEQEYKRVVARYQDKTPEFLFYETTHLVSPVINLDGSQNIPPHNTGGAVDIEIIDENGQLIDMGMAAKDWLTIQPELCLTECNLINKSAQQNRKLLLEIMQAHGFINYPTEWWHFSYGDRYWAYHQPNKQAIYGPADGLPELEQSGILTF